MINNIPFSRKETLTFLALSAAIALLLLASPLALFNLVPAQAQTAMSFRTTEPASTEDPNTGQEFRLTFDAQGTTSSSNPQSGSITDGTFQITSYPEGKVLTSGHIRHGEFSNSSRGASIIMASTVITNQGTAEYTISTACSTSRGNEISILIMGVQSSSYLGPVECSTQGGGGTTTQQSSSSSMAGSSQDGDGDGIPDSSDRCPNNSHHRCFKEGGNNTTTTPTDQQQQPSSSSNGNGNQTRQ